MISRDEFSMDYGEYLNGTYDLVDRIVLNGYYRLAQSAGGFREFWRRLHGSDENLDNTHLIRWAGRFARRVHAFANKNQIPIIECKKHFNDDQRKHEIAAELLPSDPEFVGVFWCARPSLANLAGWNVPAVLIDRSTCSRGLLVWGNPIG